MRKLLGKPLQSQNNMKSTILWDIMSCSPLNVNWLFRRTYRLHLQGRRISRAWLAICFHVSCSAYSSTLKIESICSSESTVDIQRTTQHYIPEDRTLHSHHCGKNFRFSRQHVFALEIFHWSLPRWHSRFMGERFLDTYAVTWSQIQLASAVMTPAQGAVLPVAAERTVTWWVNIANLGFNNFIKMLNFLCNVCWLDDNYRCLNTR
jgi:hypothetical protein